MFRPRGFGQDCGKNRLRNCHMADRRLNGMYLIQFLECVNSYLDVWVVEF
jgi:hypothetical protein